MKKSKINPKNTLYIDYSNLYIFIYNNQHFVDDKHCTQLIKFLHEHILHIESIVIVLGPGPSTGIRMSIALIKGIIKGIVIPVYGINLWDFLRTHPHTLPTLFLIYGNYRHFYGGFFTEHSEEFFFGSETKLLKFADANIIKAGVNQNIQFNPEKLLSYGLGLCPDQNLYGVFIDIF